MRVLELKYTILRFNLRTKPQVANLENSDSYTKQISSEDTVVANKANKSDKHMGKTAYHINRPI